MVAGAEARVGGGGVKLQRRAVPIAMRKPQPGDVPGWGCCYVLECGDAPNPNTHHGDGSAPLMILMGKAIQAW